MFAKRYDHQTYMGGQSTFGRSKLDAFSSSIWADESLVFVISACDVFQQSVMAHDTQRAGGQSCTAYGL